MRRLWQMAILALGLLGAMVAMNKTTLAAAEPLQARLQIQADVRSPHAIPAYITGKFAEHLGSNIYNGMSAQILRNPTFADYPFWTGVMSPDGRTLFHSDDAKISAEIRRLAGRMQWPEPDIQNLIDSRADGLAFWWFRQGPRQAVRVSPDTGPRTGRAQRVELQAAGQGIAQWTYLPLHRIRSFQYDLLIRSPKLTSLSLSLTPQGAHEPAATVALEGLSGGWRRLQGRLEVAPGAPAEALFRLALTSPTPGEFVIAQLLLYPADHIQGADPDVVQLLKDSKLPLLRWPGGNFVSAYHWEDGVGPLDQRPTRPNWAWGGVEPNLFGTDEFIAFCRAVGCEPMICINAGDGTPEEAARWIEYCNGPASSPMGAKRAAYGHPEPYNVKHWEVGNELWGRWQNGWTTPKGNADRYLQFIGPMLAADSGIQLYACGAPVLWGKQWNDTLFADAGSKVRSTTDHPLIGGNVPITTDPMDVYRDFMAVPLILERKWDDLRRSMRDAGIIDPKLAITELQLFAHLGPRGDSNNPVRLTGENLVNPGTQAEALYDTLIYHTAIHLAPFVEMVTHSATVNHGGGLRKDRERVYANPCHYAQSMFAAFAGATPVSIQLTAPTENAPFVLPEIKSAGPELSYRSVSALAATAGNGDLLISLVHRGTNGPIRLRVEFGGFQAGSSAELRTLAAELPWAANTLKNPDAIKPVDSMLQAVDQSLSIDLRPFSVVRVRVPAVR